MIRLYARALLASCLLVVATSAAPRPVPTKAVPKLTPESKLEAAIEKAGGTLERQNGGKTVKVTFEKLTDTAAVSLKGATFVTVIEIQDGSRCTDKTMAAIGTLADLESLSIHKSGITDAGMAWFKKLEKLKTLYLGESKITDAGVASLADCACLEDLDLTETRITNKSIDTIKTLTGLKTLALTATRVTDRGMLELKEMPNLEDLNVIRTTVSTQAIKEMEKAKPKLNIRR